MSFFTPWERGRLALDEGKLPSFQLVPCKFSPSVPAALAAGTTLGVFAAGAAALARREHAGNEAVPASTRAGRPRSQGCSMQASASCPRRGRDALVPGVVRCKQVHLAPRTSGGQLA